MRKNRELVAWLRRQIELEKALLGPNYKYTAFPREERNDLKEALKDRDFKEAYTFAESYFLCLAHADPTHCGQSWDEASKTLMVLLDKLGAGE